MRKANLLRLGCSTILSIAIVSAGGSAYAEYGTPWPRFATPLPGIVGGIDVINRVFDDPFDQPGGNLVASPKTDKPCFLSELLAGKSSCDVAGGPWARVMGGQMTTSATGVASWGGDAFANGGILGNAMIRQRVDYTGVQAGADSGLLNLEGIGVNAHVGIMGGQLSADANSIDSKSLFRNHFEVPFLGAYYVITKAGFMTDFTYRHTWYDMRMTDVDLQLNNAPLSGQSDNINASFSYKFALPNRYFIEPLANVSYTRSTFDSLSVRDTSVSSNASAGTIGFLDLAPVKSLLARGGVRFGTSFSYGGYNWAPFALALVENEFENSSKAGFTYQNSAGLWSASRYTDAAEMSTDRVGTFYQASLGISFQSQTNGLAGFVRGDWQTGDKIDGGGVVGGLRYTFGP